MSKRQLQPYLVAKNEVILNILLEELYEDGVTEFANITEDRTRDLVPVVGLQITRGRDEVDAALTSIRRGGADYDDATINAAREAWVEEWAK